MTDWHTHPWMGVFPATLCPFRADESIDEAGLRSYIEEMAAVPGVKGLTCNGHTGEICYLRHHERAQVTRIVAETVRGRCKVISGVCAEGSLEGIDDARAAQDAGADAILLMPPHEWLRFGRDSAQAVGYIEDVASVGIPIVIHQYPSWTKASYSLKEMLAMAQIPEVVCIKMGTRDMARWRYDYEQLKAARPDLSIITCHDEFLLPTLLEGADGCLVGFAGFVPELIVAMTHAALSDDLAGARRVRAEVDTLARIVYAFGEPSGNAHQRMKVARWLLGEFSSPVMRRPLRPLADEAIASLRQGLESIGYVCRQDAVTA